MRTYLFISIGGALGAILRFTIKNIQIYHYAGVFPLNTFIVNISGSFLLALFLTLILEGFKVDNDIKLGVATGFFGAYTTFSTLCKETISLLNEGYLFTGISYIIFSTLLGLAFAYLGVILANKISYRMIKNSNENCER